MSEAEAFRSLAYVVGVAALVPLVLGLLLALGMLIGPHGLGPAVTDARISSRGR